MTSHTYLGHPLVQDYHPYRDGGKETDDNASIWDLEKDDWTDGLPDYNSDDIEDDDFWQMIEYFKYLLNIIFIVTPMFLIECVFVAYNVYFNYAWNHVWANGNIWLMVNTLYLLWQCFVSILLALEYPLFMRSMRLFRFFSLLAALYYNALFLSIIFEWYRELYLEDWETYEAY